MQAPRVLRPLGLLEIVDQIFRLYRANFWVLVGIAAVIYLPVGLLQTIPGVGAFIGVGFSLLGFPLAGGALMWAFSERYLGRPASFESSYRQVLGRAPSLYLTALLAYLAYAVIIGIPGLPMILTLVDLFTSRGSSLPGTGETIVAVLSGLLCFLVAIVLSPWLPFTIGAYIMEGKRYTGAISRATFLLLRWVWAVVLAVTTIMSAITFALQMALSMPVGVAVLVTSQGASMGQTWSPLLLISGVMNGVVGAITFPLTMGVYVLLYYDSRIRKEGYDLQLLAQELETSVPPTPRALAGEEVPPTDASPSPPSADSPPTDG